jgi:hypothetical protein
MPYLFRQFLTRSYLLLFLFALAGCSSGENELKEKYTNYKFDQQVIDKLPLYDSLASAILNNFTSFRKYIKDEESYRAFRYMPSSNESESFIKLPPELAPKIDPLFNRLGNDHIYAFDLFNDSSIKIHIRVTPLPRSQVDVYESLSYYPAGNIRRRQFPDKDTILSKNWQYWARFSKQGIF